MSFVAIIMDLLKIGACLAVIAGAIYYWLTGGPPPRGRRR
jgi:hypothetical protein